LIIAGAGLTVVSTFPLSSLSFPLLEQEARKTAKARNVKIFFM